MWRIPLSDLNYGERESKAVQEVLDSGWLTMGPRTQDFETWFASYHQAAHAVAVTNCTCALELVYRHVLHLAGESRRAILVPDITFVATANAVISSGGTPVLVDIESAEKPYLSPGSVENLLSSRDDIAAVVIVHYAGHDAGAEKMAEICARYGVYLIEDCAHAPGTLTASGQCLGTIGFAGCFSFFSNKNLVTGEGGMILTDDDDLYHWARMARNHGLTASTWSRHLSERAGYDVMFPGHNYRCTEITAALGSVQLERLSQANAQRRTLTRLYHELLLNVQGMELVMPPENQMNSAACHIMPILFENAAIRASAGEEFAREEIQTSHHYRPIHSFTWYAQNNGAVYPSPENSSAFAERQMTLPLYPGLGEDRVHEITDILKSVTA